MNTPISFEIAKLLKDKGYSSITEDPIYYYIDEVNNIKEHQLKNQNDLYYADFDYTLLEDEYPAHTIQFKLFDCDLNIAKNRVMERDIWKIAEDKYGQNTHDLTDEPQVAYIDKQYEQYQSIKKWLLEVYPDKIIL